MMTAEQLGPIFETARMLSRHNEWMHAPFRAGAWRCATNGCVMVGEKVPSADPAHRIGGIEREFFESPVPGGPGDDAVVLSRGVPITVSRAELLAWCGELSPWAMKDCTCVKKQQRCAACRGTGRHACDHCDHECDCEDCDGKGTYACTFCNAECLVLGSESRPKRYARIVGAVIDKNHLVEILTAFEADQVTLWWAREGDNSRPILLSCGDRRGALMVVAPYAFDDLKLEPSWENEDDYVTEEDLVNVYAMASENGRHHALGIVAVWGAVEERVHASYHELALKGEERLRRCLREWRRMPPDRRETMYTNEENAHPGSALAVACDLLRSVLEAPPSVLIDAAGPGVRNDVVDGEHVQRCNGCGQKTASYKHTWEDCVRFLKRDPAIDMGLDTPFPLSNVIAQLARWSRHGLDTHDCDCHGYEVLMEALKAAEGYLSQLAEDGPGRNVSASDVERVWLVEVGDLDSWGIIGPVHRAAEEAVEGARAFAEREGLEIDPPHFDVFTVNDGRFEATRKLWRPGPRDQQAPGTITICGREVR